MESEILGFWGEDPTCGCEMSHTGRLHLLGGALWLCQVQGPPLKSLQINTAKGTMRKCLQRWAILQSTWPSLSLIASCVNLSSHFTSLNLFRHVKIDPLNCPVYVHETMNVKEQNYKLLGNIRCYCDKTRKGWMYTKVPKVVPYYTPSQNVEDSA